MDKAHTARKYNWKWFFDLDSTHSGYLWQSETSGVYHAHYKTNGFIIRLLPFEGLTGGLFDKRTSFLYVYTVNGDADFVPATFLIHYQET